MANKTREPERLNHTDYLSFFEEIINFKQRQVADGTWPAHLTANLTDHYNALNTIIKSYFDKRKLRIEKASPALGKTKLPLYKRVLSLKDALPTLFDGDTTVLVEFGISGDIPSDRDDLFIVVGNCVDHWNGLCDPDPPPEYASVVPFFDDLITLFPAFNDARLDYINALRDEEEAQNEMLDVREACHHEERLIFHWYRALYMEPDAEEWTATPWGASGGGNGGGGAENPFPNPLTGLNAEINVLGHASVRADEQSGAVAYNFYVAESFPGNPIPEKPFEAEWKKVSQPSIMDTQHNPGTIKTYWACGVDENGVEGEFCDPVSVEFK